MRSSLMHSSLMHSSLALAGFAAFVVFSAPALAAPVTLSPVSFSPEFQATLEDDLGPREGEVLQAAVTQAVSAALTRRGASVGQGAGLTVEVSIIDADPNRPTMAQLSEQPGLDGGRSISIGGAELHAVIRGADGTVISEVTHRRYNHSLEDVFGATTWSEARRSIRRFAEKVADAYVAAGN